MAIDLSKLLPAPWETAADWSGQLEEQFVILARNAFDVMMRRGWIPYEKVAGIWYVTWQCDRWPFSAKLEGFLCQSAFTDPFTALVEAEKWYVENVEKP